MKKLLFLPIVAAALMLSLPGCGGSSTPEVVSSDADALADLEAQMNADEEAAASDMEAGLEE